MPAYADDVVTLPRSEKELKMFAKLSQKRRGVRLGEMWIRRTNLEINDIFGEHKIFELVFSTSYYVNIQENTEAK